MIAKKLKDAVLKRPKEKPREDLYLSTGSAVLNLAFSGRPDGGYKAGHYVHLVGDSNSGKTVLAMSAFAEASINPAFDKYDLIYSGPEHGNLTDMTKFFGSKAAARVEYHDPETLEDFYAFAASLKKRKRPWVHVLDSMDSVHPEGETKGTEGYGTKKAKINSSELRVLNADVFGTNSIFIMISQTRQNIGWGAQFKPRVYSGGDAIKFYCRVQAWMSVRENLRVKVKGFAPKDRHVGLTAQVRVTKNHQCGWEGKVEIPIMLGVGVDDLGGCVDYLVEEKHWKTVKGDKEDEYGDDDKKKKDRAIVAPELDFEGRKEALIAYVEENNMEDDLRRIVAGVWREIEDKARVKRKARY
jgi:RecA/RadA recombinase